MGPFCVARRFRVTAMSSSSEVNGSCAAVTLNPLSCKIVITLLHDDPSAQAPCTSTAFVFCPMSVSFFLSSYLQLRSVINRQLRPVMPQPSNQDLEQPSRPQRCHTGQESSPSGRRKGERRPDARRRESSPGRKIPRPARAAP